MGLGKKRELDPAQVKNGLALMQLKRINTATKLKQAEIDTIVKNPLIFTLSLDKELILEPKNNKIFYTMEQDLIKVLLQLDAIQCDG
jgi:hypothetical protein